jgi:hypothetical protein
MELGGRWVDPNGGGANVIERPPTDSRASQLVHQLLVLVDSFRMRGDVEHSLSCRTTIRVSATTSRPQYLFPNIANALDSVDEAVDGGLSGHFS